MEDYFDQMVLGISYESTDQGMKGLLRKMDGYDTMLASALHLCQSGY